MRKTNGKPLTAAQKHELAALSQMSDDEIDTTDIPEVRDWTGATRGLFYRPVKQQLTLRLDADIIAWFKARAGSGEGYQTRINRALWEYVRSGEEQSMAKSPKPNDRASAPPNRTEKETANKTIIEALTRIAAAELAADDFGEYYREIAEIANPRGAAILLAAHLEEALELALSRRLQISPSSRGNVAGYDRAMETLDGKIRMAHGIKLISDETRSNLDIVRRIRNAFAHAIKPLTFETKEIAEACQLLKIPAPLPPTTGPSSPRAEPAARFQYRATCETTAHNLFVTTGLYRAIAATPAPYTV